MSFENIRFFLKSMPTALYVVTTEEDRIIANMANWAKEAEDRERKFNESMKASKKKLPGSFKAQIFSPTSGLISLADYTKDWNEGNRITASGQLSSINEAMIDVYKSKDTPLFTVILDPDRWFKDQHVVRRFLDIIHLTQQNPKLTKTLVFVGPKVRIPASISRYVEVVDETAPSQEELTSRITTVMSGKNIQAEVPLEIFQGLDLHEVEASLTQSVVKAKVSQSGEPFSLDYLRKYRQRQLKKSGILSLIDPGAISFDDLGGADKFKSWAQLHKPCWTKEGREFGLEHPKGVLLMGVYGCGKSVSAKALANEWGLPLVQFDMGRIRSSGVGESENNLYQALSTVESVAPCLLWIDEAEKSLAGASGSAHSDAGTTSRMLGILSTWVQETKSQVSIVMTANAIKNLPSEMVNRMPERFFFDLPSEDERISILKIHGRKMAQDTSKWPLAKLSTAASGLVGREIEFAMKTALVKSFGKTACLDPDILMKELELKPRIATTMKDDIESLLEWVGYDEKVQDGVRAKLASSQRSDHFIRVNRSIGG